MAEVLPLPSPPSSGSSPSRHSSLSCIPPATDSAAFTDCDDDSVKDDRREDANGGSSSGGGGGDQLSFLALLFTIFRKSWVACRTDRRRLCDVEIGWPSNVRHVAHVTFDRFNGFLGLPDDLEPEVPRRAPSASARVFGVSTESMQLSYDSRGNCVPTILLLMQQRLYDEGGLRAEGIFRINAENGQEESVRDQLNRGVVPCGIDVHCLAGLIKAWFRELPRGILDSLPPERVMQCQNEEDCMELVRQLPPTEASLVDWAINLMADVAQMEYLNKMNARNIAVVFAPNMTQMADPFTALMYAVQVMNFLKALIERTLRQRQDSGVEPPSACDIGPFDENGRESPSKPNAGENAKYDEETDQPLFAKELSIECSPYSDDDSSSIIQQESRSDSDLLDQLRSSRNETRVIVQADNTTAERDPERFFSLDGTQEGLGRTKLDQSNKLTFDETPEKMSERSPPSAEPPSGMEKSRVISNLSRMESRMAWIESWR